MIPFDGLLKSTGKYMLASGNKSGEIGKSMNTNETSVWGSPHNLPRFPWWFQLVRPNSYDEIGQ